MPDYRLYCVDRDGHMALANWIQAESDEDAIAEARKLHPGAHRCETWLKNDLVAKLNSEGQFERPHID